jgi:hypothetical protein
MDLYKSEKKLNPEGTEETQRAENLVADEKAREEVGGADSFI